MRGTVAALATPRGRSALALLRITGPNTRDIVSKIFKPLDRKATLEHSKTVFGRIFHGKTLVDTVGLTFYQAPRSYTGEDMAEITCHGGIAVPDAVLSALIDAGVSLAQPGEFTLRAFTNGKMDLTQALGVNAMTQASTQRAHVLASQRVSGQIRDMVNQLAGQLAKLLAKAEASLDFPEDVPEPQALNSEILELADKLENLLSRSVPGEMLWHGSDVVIAGPPNAGKSTLFNALVGSQRAIVHPTPGTTRDYISETIDLDGYPIRLHDTAGIAEFSAGPDSLAVQRSQQLMQKAHVVVFLSEQARGYPPNCIRVLSKADKLKTRPPANTIPVSGLTGQGLDALKSEILARLGLSHESDLALFRREQHLLSQAQSHMRRAAQIGEIELVAHHLWQGAKALEAILGKGLSGDVIQEIFSSFCLGK